MVRCKEIPTRRDIFGISLSLSVPVLSFEIQRTKGRRAFRRRASEFEVMLMVGSLWLNVCKPSAVGFTSYDFEETGGLRKRCLRWTVDLEEGLDWEL